MKVVMQTSNPAPSVWSNRNYVYLLFSGSLLTLGGKVYEMALPLILYELSNHSSVAMTTMRAIEFLPNLLLALFIGVWVDRADKKRWVVGAVALQTVLLVLLYMTHRLGADALWTYYVAGFCLMTFQYSYGNGRIAIVTNVLPKELLTPANANFSFVSTLVGICGPAISGVLLMLSDLHTGLLITAVAYGIGLFLTSRLKTETLARSTSRTNSFWQDLAEGWKVLRGNRELWSLTMFVIFFNATLGMADATTVFFAKERLLVENSTLGLLLAMEGLGGLVGSRLVVWCRNKLGTGRSIGWTIVLLAVCFGLLTLCQNAYQFAVLLFGIGVFSTVQAICIWTFRQESTPADLIGRVSGLTGSLFKLGMVWTIFGSGWLTLYFGPASVYGAACVINLLVYVVFWRLSVRRV